MLRSIDFKTMPYLFTDKAGTCLTVEFDGRELDDIYKQVKAMYDQAHSSDDMPTEPGWYATRDGEDLLSYDGDACHIPDEEVYDFYDGMTTAYEHVINYCQSLLGYSGSMPSEVPNQSEDAK